MAKDVQARGTLLRRAAARHVDDAHDGAAGLRADPQGSTPVWCIFSPRRRVHPHGRRSEGALALLLRPRLQRMGCPPALAP